MHVALVKHSSQPKPDSYNGDIILLQEKMSDNGIQCDLESWDNPDVKWDNYSLIILTSQADYVEDVEQFLQWVNRIEAMHSPCRLWNTPTVVKWNCNKKYLLELESKNMRIPATVYIDQQLGVSTQNISEAVNNGLQKYNKAIKEVVIKNIVGEGGTSVWRCKTEVTASGNLTLNYLSLKKIQQQLSSPGGRYGVMVQEFLSEVITDGEWSLLYFDKIFSHAVIKKPPSGTPDNREVEFRVQVRYGGNYRAVSQENVPEILKNFGSQILSLAPDKILYARVDVVMVGGKEPCLMELEALDPLLFFSQPSHVTTYLNVIKSLYMKA